MLQQAGLASLLGVLSALVLLPVAVIATQGPAGSPASKAPHQQIIGQLRQQRGVLTRVLPDLHPKRTGFNDEAPVPPQCYTRTEGHYNPCYVCHQNARSGRENRMNDGALQVDYAFSEVGVTNHWQNLFEDRTAAVAAISDEEIRQWIAQDNYSPLAPALRAAGFKGWIPDLADLQRGRAAFDEHGFARDGSHWVAFNYKPLPSTFWPTNGSTDDVMIRLDAPFREDGKGQYSVDVYRANLAILEARIKGVARIGSLPVDENRIGADLDGDGSLGVTTQITRVDRWVGAAADWFNTDFLYPEGTEFLHTVRYVDVDPDGRAGLSTRMKEVRYMRKWRAYSKPTYEREYDLENMAKERGQVPDYRLAGDFGLDNGFGWTVQGFIEGVDGQLRTLTYEENLFCMGCHTSIGATIDKTFSFPRKVDGADGWRYIDLVGMPDAPSAGETRGEIVTYLERVGGGGEFRNNDEMQARWFKADGTLNHEALAARPDVHTLIAPSRERALQLNKAYRTIVAAQDYIYGRDATVTPPKNVYPDIDNQKTPVLPAERFFTWDIRLDWSGQP